MVKSDVLFVAGFSTTVGTVVMAVVQVVNL